MSEDRAGYGTEASDGEVTFRIPGKPTGKGRPRFARMGKFTRTYTDAKTASYENLVKLAYCGEVGDRMRFADGPVAVQITAFFAIPKSWSKAKRAATVWHTGKPDADNIAKVTADALNGIAWTDDGQVADLRVTKVMTQDEPFVQVTIRACS